MAVRSDTLSVVHSGPTAAVNLYSCPAGVTAIVKDIRLTLAAANAATATINLHRAGAKIAVLVASVNNLGGSSSPALVGGFIVLEPADAIELVLTGPAAATADVWVSGAELAGLAP